ncbi:type IV pilus biogenesis protein PilP [Duganella sp. CT11-25]|uniref:type IV pilus biogenesis protein PilP n=1 Tax=Duganella sp. CT11-25 TaxID=3243027 RepID=UPI0039AFB436
MRNSLRLLFLVAAVAAAGRPPAAPVPAATPARAPAAVNASDALTRIESETLVLKARERQLAVQAAILQRQNEIAGKQDEGARLSSAPVSGNPVVQSLEGIGKNQYATLLFESGSLVEVRAGDVLADGMRVVAIQSNGVIVETAKKKRMRLHLMGGAPAPFNPALPRPAVGLPPLFPGAKGSER